MVASIAIDSAIRAPVVVFDPQERVNAAGDRFLVTMEFAPEFRCKA
jgi:hypothetical protein